MKIREKVLLIEDERTIRGFMQAILTANGYDVLMAGTGAMANTMISSHCPDLIILDLGLPDMDGMTILRSVRELVQGPHPCRLRPQPRARQGRGPRRRRRRLPHQALRHRGAPRAHPRRHPPHAHARRRSRRRQFRRLHRGRPHHRLRQAPRLHRRPRRRPHPERVQARRPPRPARGQSPDLRLPHQGALGPQRPQRQPDPPRQHGQHPPQDRKKPRPARLHLHRIRRRLPHDRRRLKTGGPARAACKFFHHS